MAVTVRRVDPLEYGDQLKALFRAHQRPEFPDWYDRSYPIAVAEGAASWVLMEEGGKVVGHVAGFTADLAVEGRVSHGALLANLMVDQAHRTFFPAAAMIKKAVKDLRADGAEFIYTNPNNPGAVATMRAGGLREVAWLNRFLFMTGHTNPVVTLGLRAMHAGRRLILPSITAEATPPAEAVRWTVEESRGVSAVTARRRASVYLMREGPFDPALDLGFRLVDGSGAQVGAALVRLAPPPEDSRVVTLRCRTELQCSAAIAAIGAVLRRRGVRRMNASALMNTGFARALVRGGCFERREPWSIAAIGFSDLGTAAVAGIGQSDLEKIDLD